MKSGAFFCYLKDKKETCIIELWQEALHNFGTKPTKKDSIGEKRIYNFGNINVTTEEFVTSL